MDDGTIEVEEVYLKDNTVFTAREVRDKEETLICYNAITYNKQTGAFDTVKSMKIDEVGEKAPSYSIEKYSSNSDDRLKVFLGRGSDNEHIDGITFHNNSSDYESYWYDLKQSLFFDYSKTEKASEKKSRVCSSSVLPDQYKSLLVDLFERYDIKEIEGVPVEEIYKNLGIEAPKKAITTPAATPPVM